jgi:predicted nucleic acid-binding protein
VIYLKKILIDTMHIYALLTSKDRSYLELSRAIEEEKVAGVVSIITLTELVNILGKNIYRAKLNELLSSNLDIVDADRTIAIHAGELHMNYGLPIGDALIAATGITENVKHILTEDVGNGHFDSIKNLIKPINLKAALRLIK